MTPIILLALPFIVGATTWHRLNMINESLEWIDVALIGVVGIVGFFSQLVTLPVHQRLAPLATMTLGFLMLVGGRFVWTGEQTVTFLFTMGGAGAMIIGGIWSRRLFRNKHDAFCTHDHGASCSKSRPSLLS